MSETKAVGCYECGEPATYGVEDDRTDPETGSPVTTYCDAHGPHSTPAPQRPEPEYPQIDYTNGWQCSFCGHRHTGSAMGYICVGCRCEAVPPSVAAPPVTETPEGRLRIRLDEYSQRNSRSVSVSRADITAVLDKLDEAEREITTLRQEASTGEEYRDTLRVALADARREVEQWKRFAEAEFDRRKEVVAEVASLRGQGWQPIETMNSVLKNANLHYWVVPKTADEAYTDTSGNPIVSRHAPRLHCGTFNSWSAMEKATHWQPLPPPPQETGQ